ncbi:hypothetical protein [Paenibacillus prosopidis]|uniref:Collagen triple helix repeat protein n=1 Tax=Paenibacillus prosopidis TaxID=630520 RepID=A0A368VL20_9BACL|nr:hypothetical protein [Paenibacillus prosopidis]RCW42228.1 hypothetical protein DFP97_11857 [Paenibacillus prosopidis]
MQNHPYFQHPAGSPKFHPTPQNNEFQPNSTLRPRDDYFQASHYTWHHDSDQDDIDPAMYQTQEHDAVMKQGVQGVQGFQGFQGVQGVQGFQGVQGVQDASPDMHHPWLHTHSVSPAMTHPWNPHVHDVSPTMYNPMGLHIHDVSPAMFHPWDPDHDPHPEGWAHYSVDYHYDWYQHWDDDDQRAQDFYPAGYNPWLDYRW